MDRRSLRSLWLVASLGLALVLVIGSAWPSVAAPPLQQGPTLTFQTPNLPNDLPASQRGAFALMSDAERTVANALLAVEADPLFTTTAAVTGTNLLPSTNTVLGVTHNMLGTIGDGLDDFNLIASREAVPPRTVAPAPGLATTPTVTGGAFTTATPALTTTPTVTGGALTTTTPALTTTPTVTGGALTTTTPALAVTPTLPGPGSIFTPTTAQPQFGVAGGACGDLVNLVRAARRDVARIQGRAGFFGGLFTNVDPAERRAALDSLRSDHQQMQQALQCLAQSQPVPVTGQRTPRAIGTQAPLTTTISLTPTVVGSPAATITTTASVTETGPVAPRTPIPAPPTTTTTPLTETGAVSPSTGGPAATVTTTTPLTETAEALGQPGGEVALTDITANPQRYYGQTVTVTGTVDVVLSPNAFTIARNNLLDLGEITVLSSTPRRALNAGERLQVTGIVRQFVRGEIERDLDFDLGEDLSAQFENKPVIIASSVQPVR